MTRDARGWVPSNTYPVACHSHHGRGEDTHRVLPLFFLLSAIHTVCAGLGTTMPSATTLAGIPQISGGSQEHKAAPATTLTGEGTAPGSSSSPSGNSVAALMANLLPQANAGLTSATQGVYVGEGLPPMPAKLAVTICRGDFVNMGELLPEFWTPSREDDPQAKAEAKSRPARAVQNIYTWLQCFGMYVSVLAPLHPDRVPELIPVNQAKTMLGWHGFTTTRPSEGKRP